MELNSLSLIKFFGIFDYATLKNDISAVIYSSISSYTSLERAKIKLSEKKYFGEGYENIIVIYISIEESMEDRNVLRGENDSKQSDEFQATYWAGHVIKVKKKHILSGKIPKK